MAASWLELGQPVELTKKSFVENCFPLSLPFKTDLWSWFWNGNNCKKQIALHKMTFDPPLIDKTIGSWLLSDPAILQIGQQCIVQYRVGTGSAVL